MPVTHAYAKCRDNKARNHKLQAGNHMALAATLGEIEGFLRLLCTWRRFPREGTETFPKLKRRRAASRRRLTRRGGRLSRTDPAGAQHPGDSDALEASASTRWPATTSRSSASSRPRASGMTEFPLPYVLTPSATPRCALWAAPSTRTTTLGLRREEVRWNLVPRILRDPFVRVRRIPLAAEDDLRPDCIRATAPSARWLSAKAAAS